MEAALTRRLGAPEQMLTGRRECASSQQAREAAPRTRYHSVGRAKPWGHRAQHRPVEMAYCPLHRPPVILNLLEATLQEGKINSDTAFYLAQYIQNAISRCSQHEKLFHPRLGQRLPSPAGISYSVRTNRVSMTLGPRMARESVRP
jgi:hypothetical protein